MEIRNTNTVLTAIVHNFNSQTVVVIIVYFGVVIIVIIVSDGPFIEFIATYWAIHYYFEEMLNITRTR